MKEVFLDALLDSLKILPFLIIVYIIIEVIESHSKFKKNKLLQSRIAPLFGAGVGLVPQCGFSVMATNLYAHRNISLGTLVAVYIATSDEAIPILLSNYDKIGMLFPLILIKFAMALVAGFALDLVMKRPKQKALPLQKSQTKACNLGKNGEAEASTAANSEAETKDAEKLFETLQNADTQQASKIERVEEPASLAEKSICAVTSKTEVTEAKDTASTASLAEKSICAVNSKTEITEAKDTASTVQGVDKKTSCKAESAQDSTTFDKNIGHDHAEAGEDGGGHDHAEAGEGGGSHNHAEVDEDGGSHSHAVADEDGGGYDHAEADEDCDERNHAEHEDGGGHNHAEHEADEPQKGCCGHSLEGEPQKGCCGHSLEGEPQKGCCGHSLSKVQVYLVHPLVHSLKIFVYILLVNLAMGIAIFYLGQEKLQAIMLSSHAFQPFLAGLIGMIPNCASSVLITELYLLGGLNLGSAVAGLSVNAGIAFAVLFQQNKPQKQNFAILIGLYLFSCTVGTLIMLIF